MSIHVTFQKFLICIFILTYTQANITRNHVEHFVALNLKVN